MTNLSITDSEARLFQVISHILQQMWWVAGPDQVRKRGGFENEVEVQGPPRQLVWCRCHAQGGGGLGPQKSRKFSI